MNENTYDFRIKSGTLFIMIRKKRPWFFKWLPRKFYFFRFQVRVVTSSGVLFEYSEFKMFLTKEQAKEMLFMVREICTSNFGATRHMEHDNVNIRHLAYLKQTDFRDIPIRIVIDSDQDKNKRDNTVNEYTYAPYFAKKE